ncbi:MAG: DUF4880 domain-containing protein [Cellvibrionales bacterium]|jgi:transmembrane sensor|nr:DUF4880 domain-containing protein [Cellvibrionales bacterium]
MDNVVEFDGRQSLEDEACLWLIRLDGDKPLTENEQAELHGWAGRSPAHHAELRRISSFWNDNNVLTELSIPLHHHSSHRQAGHESSIIRNGFAALLGFKGLSAATACFCLLGLAFVFRQELLPQPLDATNGVYATAIGGLRVEVLADGSVLQMNTDSQVQVQYSEQRRKIRLLRGEAHFEVAHNAAWPFEVYAGGGRVKATGTAFSVRLHEQDNMLNVIVTDGQVELSSPMQESLSLQSESQSSAVQHPLSNQVLAKPQLQVFASLGEGEGVTFSPDINGVESRGLSLQEVERHLAWRQGYLVFTGEPLSLVVEELNRYQVISIEIADATLSEMPIGGRFKVGELEALLDALASNFGIQVSRIDEQHIQLLPK